jgi:DNA-binding transcriptional regulator YhcF (GntR family)
MFLHIDYNSGEPISRQVSSQIKLMVVSGELKPGERMPSIRELARNLKINPTTASRIYNELAHEGVLVLRRGQGAFISEETGQKLASSEISRKVEDHARTMLVEGLRLGLDFKEIKEIVKDEYNKIRGEKK